MKKKSLRKIWIDQYRLVDTKLMEGCLTAKESVNKNFYPAMKGLPSSYIADYKGEPFKGENGRFVGSDDFVVPGYFSEFFERTPNYVRNWVAKRLHRMINDPLVEDWTSELQIFLQVLPEGTLKDKGFVDVVDAFNPWSAFGASARRFYAHINRCLFNRYLTIQAKQKKDALSTNELVSLDFLESIDYGDGAGSGEQHRDRFMCSNSATYNELVGLEEHVLSRTLFVERFLSFVKEKDSSLADLAQAIMKEEKIDDITSTLNITHSEFTRKRKKLMKLSSSFSR
jgi:hypothetical protein